MLKEYTLVPLERRQFLKVCVPDKGCSCTMCQTIPLEQRKDLIRWCVICFALWIDITIVTCPHCGKEDT